MNGKIDISLTAAEKAAITAAAHHVSALMPFLRAFTPEERRTLHRLGPRRESFSRLALEVARQNSIFIPQSVNLEELERDLALHEVLTTVRTQFQQLLQQVEDTQHVAGRDLYAGALEIYRALKGHGEGAGLEHSLADLKTRFRAAPRREEEPAAPELSEG